MKGKKEKEDAKPPTAPKKYVPFSVNDTRSIENAYQKLLEELEGDRERGMATRHVQSNPLRLRSTSGEDKLSSSSMDTEDDTQRRGVRVPVNEDFLFDVDIENRELAPVYWLGPIYEVRRGSWFYQEGSTLRPCEENLAAQLEEGFLKVKPVSPCPWFGTYSDSPATTSNPRFWRTRLITDGA